MQEHQECVTIKTRFRPVPLHWHYCFKGIKSLILTDLLDPSGKGLNPKLDTRQRLVEEAR